MYGPEVFAEFRAGQLKIFPVLGFVGLMLMVAAIGQPSIETLGRSWPYLALMVIFFLCACYFEVRYHSAMKKVTRMARNRRLEYESQQNNPSA